MMAHRRERLYAAAIAEIKQVARQQMAAQGTAAITLRSIAEQMGFTSQALYRYFASRDALLTSLILDAYTDLATTMKLACDTLPPDAYGERLFSMLMAYHQWAVDHPVDYTLIYGTPIPDFQEPLEQTQTASMKAPALVLSVMYEAWQQNRLTVLPEYTPLRAELAEHLGEIQTIWQETFAHEIPVELLYTMVISWSRLHGLIMLEICGHLHGIAHVDAFYRFELLTLLQRMGLSIQV